MTEEGISQVIAHVPVELATAFKEMCRRRNQPIRAAQAALMRLWLEIPLDLQARLLCEDEQGPQFKQLVREIVADELARQDVAAAQDDVSKQKPKQSHNSPPPF